MTSGESVRSRCLILGVDVALPTSEPAQRGPMADELVL